jgi:hypothetical protein
LPTERVHVYRSHRFKDSFRANFGGGANPIIASFGNSIVCVLILGPEVDLDPAALPPAVFKQYQSPIETACLHFVPFGTLEQKDSVEITQLNTHCDAVFSGSSC